jgi:hypothetical protein
MQNRISLALAAGVSALAFGAFAAPAANAADMGVPQGEYYQGPGPEPPQEEEGYAYPPPRGVYGYPPPAVAYAAPPVVFVPGPYYAPGPYWRGYGPRFAYGYGRYGYWGRGYRRW